MNNRNKNDCNIKKKNQDNLKLNNNLNQIYCMTATGTASVLQSMHFPSSALGVALSQDSHPRLQGQVP
eukprot:2282516-Amphidinium_carterae.1